MNRLLCFCSFALITNLAVAGPAEQAVEACDQALQAGDYAKAAAQAEAALRVSPELRDAFLCLARAEGERGNHAAAVAALQSAERVSKEPVEHIVALTLLGNEYQAGKEYSQAISAYTQSLEIARSERNTDLQRTNINLIGEAYLNAGDGQAALAQYEQGLKLAANDNERADGQARLASAYARLGHYDKAIEHQLKAALYEEASGDLNHYAHANIELGRYAFEAKQYADAEKWLRKFIGTIADSGDSYWQAKAHVLLAKVAHAKDAPAEAAKELAQAKALAQKAGVPELTKEIAEAEAKSM